MTQCESNTWVWATSDANAQRNVFSPIAQHPPSETPSTRVTAAAASVRHALKAQVHPPASGGLLQHEWPSPSACSSPGPQVCRRVCSSACVRAAQIRALCPVGRACFGVICPHRNAPSPLASMTPPLRRPDRLCAVPHGEMPRLVPAATASTPNAIGATACAGALAAAKQHHNKFHCNNLPCMQVAGGRMLGPDQPVILHLLDIEPAKQVGSNPGASCCSRLYARLQQPASRAQQPLS